ncbi:hypothetical protein P12x_003141 [Tundrisphaera lichenicola]|uniref:hypothetical protein n=1 Tax=Tundrisphaera lichenicola TaxID=2029860 RepID=UPI003EC048AE
MTLARSWIATTLTAASLIIGWSDPGRAQDPGPKDEGLEKLLEKLDLPEPGDKARDADKDKEKDPATVAPTDESLDKLLEGLGQTKDAPAPDDKKPGAPGGDPMPPSPDQPKPDGLGGDDKDLDKLLEELTGKKEKPKKDRNKDEEGSGPLGQVIKEMRDVEERLGQPDTGEETRKKQAEIVKNLESLIEQLKNAPSQSQGMKMIRAGKKPGTQPGQEQNQPGAMAQGANPSRPEKPKTPQLPTEIAKEIWGQLPSQFRDEMANVLNEHPLPTRTDLIRLYYLSLGKKSTSREE